MLVFIWNVVFLCDDVGEEDIGLKCLKDRVIVRYVCVWSFVVVFEVSENLLGEKKGCLSFCVFLLGI